MPTASVQRAVRSVIDRFGRIDCLVNNAGGLTPGPLVKLAVREVDRILAVNLRGPILLARAVEAEDIVLLKHRLRARARH